MTKMIIIICDKAAADERIANIYYYVCLGHRAWGNWTKKTNIILCKPRHYQLKYLSYYVECNGREKINWQTSHFVSFPSWALPTHSTYDWQFKVLVSLAGLSVQGLYIN